MPFVAEKITEIFISILNKKDIIDEDDVEPPMLSKSSKWDKLK